MAPGRTLSFTWTPFPPLSALRRFRSPSAKAAHKQYPKRARFCFGSTPAATTRTRRARFIRPTRQLATPERLAPPTHRAPPTKRRRTPFELARQMALEVFESRSVREKRGQERAQDLGSGVIAGTYETRHTSVQCLGNRARHVIQFARR
jgi:hypothetical protein